MFGIEAPIWAAGISSAANLGGGLISSAGQAAANAENVRNQNMMNQQMLNAQMAAHEQNTAFQEDTQAFNRQERQYAEDFNASQAEKNRVFQANEAATARDVTQNFQERMASTQYQRAMNDMRAAGLNPILAYQQGGNASPSGSSAVAGGSSASSPGGSGGGTPSALGAPSLRAPTVTNNQDMIGRALGNAVTSALDTLKASADIDLQRQREKESAENVRRSGYQTPVLEMDAKKRKEEVEKTRAETDQVKATTTGITIENIVRAVDAVTAQQYGGKLMPGTLERILRTVQQGVESTPQGSVMRGTGIGQGRLSKQHQGE